MWFNVFLSDDNVEDISDDIDGQPTARFGHVEMNSAKGQELETAMVRTPQKLSDRWGSEDMSCPASPETTSGHLSETQMP